MSDEERLNWLEAMHSLHQSVEILYVVDGYEIQVTHDGNPEGKPVHGQTLRHAIDAAAALVQP